MRSKRSRFLVFAIAIGSVGLLTLFFITSTLEETPEKRKARELGYLREWVACDFVDVDETFESKVLPQIPKTISPGIRAEQEAAATEAVAGFVKAFSSGRYEDFKAFRMPAKYSLSQSNLATLSKILLKGIPTNTMTFAPPSPPEWTVLGNRRNIPSTVIKPPFQKHEVRPENIVTTIHRWNSQGTGYKQYFEGVCAKKSYMALLNTNQTIGYLWDYVLKNEDNLGVSGPGNPLSRLIRFFERTPRDILEETGEISYLTAKLHLRLAYPDPVKPIYCRWYWEPAEAKWLPMDLVTSSSQKRSKISLAFP